MFRRRRSRNRSTWFPILPTVAGGEGSEQFLTFLQYTQTPAGTGEIVTEANATALVNDANIPATETTQGVSLRDQVQGQTWRCDRIVGSLFCQYSYDGDAGLANGQLVCAAGIGVFPVDDVDGDSIEMTNIEYQPLQANNSTNPWLWRRLWLLGGPTTYGPPGTGAGFLPQCNMQYGDVASGPKVDTKGLKRIIQREQRLFLVTQFGSADGSALASSDNFPVVTWTYDFRIVGRLVNAKNRSTWK